MKKLIGLLFVSLFLLGGVVFAEVVNLPSSSPERKPEGTKTKVTLPSKAPKRLPKGVLVKRSKSPPRTPGRRVVYLREPLPQGFYIWWQNEQVKKMGRETNSQNEGMMDNSPIDDSGGQSEVECDPGSPPRKYSVKNTKPYEHDTNLKVTTPDLSIE
ncbi:MAG: hypothetical protein KJ732_02575 [Candidatus Margulisbacteria bacterium]|nr:hypothetical protein [Candidatus Margulisiibacteriota bacterium]